MGFELENVIGLLERTPAALDALLHGLPEVWTETNEGENTWSVRTVIAPQQTNVHGIAADSAGVYWATDPNVMTYDDDGGVRLFADFGGVHRIAAAMDGARSPWTSRCESSPPINSVSPMTGAVVAATKARATSRTSTIWMRPSIGSAASK